jgi:hypothetical protein
MANSVVVQIIQEGQRNAIVKITGELDTSDVAVNTILPMSLLNQSGTGATPTSVRIDHIDYSIGQQIEVVLDWHATTNVPILPIAGRGKMTFLSFGGLQNNAGVGKNGAIDIWTTGYASGIQVFSIVLELVKQGAYLG